MCLVEFEIGLVNKLLNVKLIINIDNVNCVLDVVVWKLCLIFGNLGKNIFIDNVLMVVKDFKIIINIGECLLKCVKLFIWLFFLYND